MVCPLENITILNVCAPIKIGEEYVKRKLMELKEKETNPQLWLENSTPLIQHLVEQPDRNQVRV